MKPKLTEEQREWLVGKMFDKFQVYDEHMSMTIMELDDFLAANTEEQPVKATVHYEYVGEGKPLPLKEQPYPECPLCKKSKLRKVVKPDIWYWACPHCDSTYNSGHFANTEECPYCKGQGEGEDYERGHGICIRCGGRGKIVWQSVGGKYKTLPCPVCGSDYECPICDREDELGRDGGEE